MNIRNAIIPIGVTRRGRPLKSFSGVTIHNTGNHDAGANADANARYLYSNASTNIAGFHYVVDKDEIVCTIPENEIVEHSGTRTGNDTTVSIEICDNRDGNILAATENGAQLAADILKRHGMTQAVWKTNLFQHNDWSGKDCPEDIRAGNPYHWDAFVSKVNAWMNASTQPPVVTDSPPTFHISKVLKYTPDSEVVAIQRNLNSLHYNAGPEDGVYGPVTEAAVKKFQEDYHIAADGIVGRETTLTLGGIWDGP